MWCIPTIDQEFIERMEEVLTLYARPYDRTQPVRCFDEKSKQLREDTRPSIPATPGAARRSDYEYRRNGTANLFLTVAPQAGYRTVRVTPRRTRQDFAHEMRRIAERVYPDAARIHVVLDNLNTHRAASLAATFGTAEAERLMERIEFHHTPTHASWLNMAEIELSILGRQCLNQRIPTARALQRAVSRWQSGSNRRHRRIRWKFTVRDARNVFRYNT